MAAQKRSNKHSIRRLLVANRSEIACRILATARAMNIETVAVYSQADENARHVSEADQAVALGGRTPAESYLDIDKIIEAARSSGADAIHPGYGFLAENAEFARAAAKAGLTFVGPSPECIETMGDKLRARQRAQQAGLPMIPATSLGQSEAEGARAAAELGYPILVKAVAGGGGRGMRAVENAHDLSHAIAAARREAEAAFGDGRLYLEKRIRRPRHIEVQIFGDGRGGAVDLGERECSMQRRHQKVIEESPAVRLDPSLQAKLIEAALALAKGLSYAGAGTVEFIVGDDNTFYFLEMNTRLQVEHAVTEMITRSDMVRLQLESACGSTLAPPPPAVGHSIECRVYAEDPAAGFLPTSGRVLLVDHPRGAGIRVDSALYDGVDLPIEYDPMLAKVVAWAPDRAQCIGRMTAALQDFALLGVTTNIAFLIDVLGDRAFAEGDYSTETLERRFVDWKPLAASECDHECIDVGAAALAVLLNQAGASDSQGAGGTRGSAAAPGPWQSLGAWRLGNRKHRDGSGEGDR